MAVRCNFLAVGCMVVASTYFISSSIRFHHLGSSILPVDILLGQIACHTSIFHLASDVPNL